MSLTKQTDDDVMAFCLEHKLTDKLALVVDLMNQAFPDAQRVTVGLEQDPESDDRYVMVDVVVHGPAKEVHRRHHDCALQIMNVLPWPQWPLIRTIYTLA
jgi:hypothetical protein